MQIALDSALADDEKRGRDTQDPQLASVNVNRDGLIDIRKNGKGNQDGKAANEKDKSAKGDRSILSDWDSLEIVSGSNSKPHQSIFGTKSKGFKSGKSTMSKGVDSDKHRELKQRYGLLMKGNNSKSRSRSRLASSKMDSHSEFGATPGFNPNSSSHLHSTAKNNTGNFGDLQNKNQDAANFEPIPESIHQKSPDKSKSVSGTRSGKQDGSQTRRNLKKQMSQAEMYVPVDLDGQMIQIAQPKTSKFTAHRNLSQCDFSMYANAFNKKFPEHPEPFRLKDVPT